MSLREQLARAEFEAFRVFHSDPAYYVEWDELDEERRNNYLRAQTRRLLVIEDWLKEQNIEAVSVFHDDVHGMTGP